MVGKILPMFLVDYSYGKCLLSQHRFFICDLGIDNLYLKSTIYRFSII